MRWRRLSKTPPVAFANRRTLFVLALLAVPTVAQAQALPELSLEELMRVDAGRVFGASERVQPVPILRATC